MNSPRAPERLHHFRASIFTPWSMLVHPRSLAAAVASHVGVALLAVAAVLLVYPTALDPAHRSSTAGLGEPARGSPAPRTLGVDVRGGAPTAADPPGIHGFTPGERVGMVVRHDGGRSDDARMLVRVTPRSAGSTRSGRNTEIYVSLDPRRMDWRGQALRYEGTTGEVLPLRPGLWRVTFMLSDAERCGGSPLHVCAQADAWLRLL